MALNNRDRILASAVTLFAKRGAARVTLRDIAQDSGLLLGTIFHFFPQKEALLKAAMVMAYEGRSLHIHAALSAPGTAEDKLRSLVADLIRRYDEEDPYLLLVDRNNADGGAKLASEAVRQNLRDNYNSLASIIVEIGGKPLSSNSDARVAFIFSMIFGFAKLYNEYGGILKIKRNGEDRSVTDQLVSFIVGAIKASD